LTISNFYVIFLSVQSISIRIEVAFSLHFLFVREILPIPLPDSTPFF
jgi:hypothetical protein